MFDCVRCEGDRFAAAFVLLLILTELSTLNALSPSEWRVRLVYWGVGDRIGANSTSWC